MSCVDYEFFSNIHVYLSIEDQNIVYDKLAQSFLNYINITIEYTSQEALKNNIEYVSDENFINYEYMDGPIGFYPIKKDFPDLNIDTKNYKGRIIDTRVQWKLIKVKPTILQQY